jgi:para-aminobenzoate synthetase/4-amino-4-deoxychorismate lyase
MSKPEQTALTPWQQLPAHLHSIVSASANSVLLQTSRFDSANHKSLLFLDPVQILSASHLDEIPELFQQIERALAEGFHLAGYLSYECGYHFERFADIDLSTAALPLAWFGVYRDPIVFDHETGAMEPPQLSFASSLLPSIPTRLAERVELNISERDYRAKISQIQQYIAAGDTYQVNFTDSVSLPITSPPAAAFAALVKQQPVAYSAFLHVAGHHILSLSPELFFKIEQGTILTRPMKGTMPRGLDSAEDAAAAIRLQHDEKNRAEHLMIVDLLRNDLGRISEMGSVHVNGLFSVERYATLLQMTSTVSGKLRGGLSPYDIFKALFPSGSITGAPKIRTMQIIRELEQAPRGIYTGAIGFLSPNGSSTFNVAIRTLVLKDGEAHMGVGGGIVADSNAEEEYKECRLKTEFLVRARYEFQLIETMLWEGDFTLFSLHLDRLQSSASYFDFQFDPEAVSSALAKATEHFAASDRHRVRLLLDEAGRVTVTATKLQDNPTGQVRLSAQRTSSRDVFLRHKTTHRTLYDAEHATARADGFDDVLFMNERGELTEGAISNLFIQQGERLLTPPLSCGVLPGVFRRHLLETNPAATEQVLSLPDLRTADAVFLCNSVRGLRQVTIS